MDRNLLYKIPKDVLVELVCKNFNNLSIKELGQIYRDKCWKEMEKYRKILERSYFVSKSFRIEYRKGGIYIENLEFGDFYREIYIEDIALADEYDKSLCFQTLELLLIRIREMLLNEKISIEEVMKLIHMLIKTHHDKQEMMNANILDIKRKIDFYVS